MPHVPSDTLISDIFRPSIGSSPAWALPMPIGLGRYLACVNGFKSIVFVVVVAAPATIITLTAGTSPVAVASARLLGLALGPS
ncbi:hypothetical protein ACLOJK_039981 [Asimina triloba]